MRSAVGSSSHTAARPAMVSAPGTGGQDGSLRSARWRTVPLVLVVVMLLGSVLIPARQTWRIMNLLRETTDVIEPARLVGARLEQGLMVESAALEAYELTGDSVQLARYFASSADDDRRLASLESLARGLDSEAVDRAAAVRSRLAEWRKIGGPAAALRSPGGDATTRTRQASYQAALRDIGRLSAYMAAEGSARRELIRGTERLGLVVNASLVFLALAAVLAVGALSYRERQLTLMLRRRIQEEAALREVARTLSGAVTREEVMRYLAQGATATTRVSEAYVECAEAGGETVQRLVHQSGGAPSPCVRGDREGSLTGLAMAGGGTGSLVEVDSIADAGWKLPGRDGTETPRSGLVATLTSGDQNPGGVLMLLRDRSSAPFGEDTRRQVQILADLASAALQRVSIRDRERRALAEAERRARQEAALREAAEALAAAFTIEEVTQQIVRTAVEATHARGAFVEQITLGEGEGEVVVRASAGTGVPELGATVPYPGSCAERAITARAPLLVLDLARDEGGCTARTELEDGCSAIVVPLGHGPVPIGALFILSAAQTPFREEDIARAHTFGHLAALAYEKVRLLDEAREGRRELERVMKSRSRLMRGFSHDVKNPLGAADGFASLLEEGIYGTLSAMQLEKVERMRECIHGALALIDDLHELARAEAGQIALSIRLVDITQVVRSTVEEYRAAAEMSGLSLSMASAPDLPLVETDPPRVRQIVGNLLSNAIKYTSSGSIRVHVTHDQSEPGADGGAWAVIEVSDTGRGIAEEKREAIFEEFIRVGADEKSGAGLGLAISQRLAEALGGRIEVRSELGHGSTFAFRLPLPIPAAQAPQ